MMRSSAVVCAMVLLSLVALPIAHVEAQRAAEGSVPLRPSVKAPTRAAPAEGRTLIDSLDGRLVRAPKRKGAAAAALGDAASTGRASSAGASTDTPSPARPTPLTGTPTPAPPTVRAAPKRS